MSNDHVHPIFQGILSAIAPPNHRSAFQEGQDAHRGKEAPINPYRIAMRSLTDPESLERLSKLATQWEDGYVSVNR